MVRDTGFEPVTPTVSSGGNLRNFEEFGCPLALRWRLNRAKHGLDSTASRVTVPNHPMRDYKTGCKFLTISLA